MANFSPRRQSRFPMQPISGSEAAAPSRTITQRSADNPMPHPRELTGRAPTWADFSASGQAQGEADFSQIASNPRTQALAAAENASGRVSGWREKNPGKKDNAYVVGEERRRGQMETISNMVSDSPTPVTMDMAAERVADNYAAAGQRTLRGDVGLTHDDLGPASLGRFDLSSAEHLAAGKGTVLPAGGSWYLEHGGHLKDVAEAHGADLRTTVISSSSMSPQNSPYNERIAAEAITNATQRGKTVSMRHPEDISEAERKTSKYTPAKHTQAIEDLSLTPGETRTFSDFAPEQVAKMARHRAVLGGTANVEALGHGGTEVETGVRMARGEKTQSDFGESGKVPTYAHQSVLGAGLPSLGEPGPDANDISEYNRRVHESIPGNHPYHEQPTLFGDEDPYGRAHSTQGILNTGHQPDKPIQPSVSARQFYPVSSKAHDELHEGSTAQDTWQMAQALTLPRDIEGAKVNDARNPALVAKTLASDPTTVKFGGGDTYIPTPAGTRKASPAEVQHAVFNEVHNRATDIVTQRARAAGRNVGAGVPAVAVQGGSWTGYRQDMGKDLEYDKRMAHINKPPNVAAPGATPQPGQDVPMFDEAGTALDYGKSWKAKRRITQRGT